MPLFEFQRDGLLLSNDRSRLVLADVHAMLRQTHWASSRPIEKTAKGIEHSLCYGIYLDGRQVAFARVITDYSLFAYLLDVVVDPAFRGRGLGKWMMDAIMANPDLASLRRFVLATKDAHGLYERYGFTLFSEEERRPFMEILKEDV